MYVIIMNNPSMEKFEKMVEPNGTVILNSTLITLEPKRTDVNYLKVPANELAEQAGSQRSANMVMLGVIGWLWKDISHWKSWSRLWSKSCDKRPQLVETNKKAIELGYEFAKNLV